jgi:hypothetical protein
VNIILTANTGFTFTGGLAGRSINGLTATVSNNTGTSVTLSRQFPATSDGSLTWNAIEGGTGPGQSTFGVSTINSITFGDGRFVAVGWSGRMAWSNNGTSWNEITATQSTFGGTIINNITFGNGRFVAVGFSGRMAWSDNGTSWTEITSTQSTFGAGFNINGITYGNGRFVAVGVNGNMARSDDGISWTAITGGTGENPITAPGQSTFGRNQIIAITYGNGRFVAGGNNGRMAWSDDGITWNAIPGGTGTGTSWDPITDPGPSTFGSNIISSMTYGNGRFVAGGGGGRMAWSDDGISWTAVPGGTGLFPVTVPGQSTFGEIAIRCITYGNGRFVAGGSFGRMAWSDDGITWNAITGGTGSGPNPVTVPGQSTFGENWISGITYGNGRFVAVGEGGRMAWANCP